MQIPRRLRGSRGWVWFERLLGWQPMTLRGLLAALLALFAIQQFGIPEMDLVALILGGGVFALVLGVVAVALLIRFRLGRLLTIQANFDLQDPRSRRPIQSGLVLSGSSVPAYFSLELERLFSHDGVRSSIHVIKGKEPEQGKRHLIDTIVVPHRGLWQLTGVRCTIGDSLGFSRLRWVVPATAGVEAAAQTLPIKPLPVVAASSRAGDQLNQTRERVGDLFDIKQYDPSDGIKRILWKTYAKSGELVVRRPEPAVIPEGEVALYLVAGKQDDHVAGALQDYIRQLHAQQITILFGTDGLFYKGELPEHAVDGEKTTDSPAAAGMPFYTTNPDEIQRAINLSAMSSRAGTGADFESYLESLQAESRFVHHAIVFAPAGDRRENGAQLPLFRGEAVEESLWFARLSRAAQQSSVKLTVALVPYQLDLEARLTQMRRKVSQSAEPPLQRILAVLQPSNRVADGPTQRVRELSSRIVQSGAELYMIEGYE